MGGESPFSCFDIIHLNIIRCVIRTPVIGQIFMLLDPFNFKVHYEIFKHSKSTGLLTWFEISQLLNSNFCSKFLLRTFGSNFWLKLLLQIFATNFCFQFLLWKLKKCCAKIKYFSFFVCEQWETHSKHLNGKPIENDCIFSNPNERTELLFSFQFVPNNIWIFAW